MDDSLNSYQQWLRKSPRKSDGDKQDEINLEIEASQMCPSVQYLSKCDSCKKSLPLGTPEWKKLCLSCYYGSKPEPTGKCLILTDSDDE